MLIEDDEVDIDDQFHKTEILLNESRFREDISETWDKDLEKISMTRYLLGKEPNCYKRHTTKAFNRNLLFVWRVFIGSNSFPSKIRRKKNVSKIFFEDSFTFNSQKKQQKSIHCLLHFDIHISDLRQYSGQTLGSDYCSSFSQNNTGSVSAKHLSVFPLLHQLVLKTQKNRNFRNIFAIIAGIMHLSLAFAFESVANVNNKVGIGAFIVGYCFLLGFSRYSIPIQRIPLLFFGKFFRISLVLIYFS